MKFKIITVWLFSLLIVFPSYSQDEIILKDGTIIKGKVTEVGPTEVKFKKWENLEGPTYSNAKGEVFMIKYENGSKDVFSGNNEAGASEQQSVFLSGNPATIYFIRPKKMAASSPEIIVGTTVPDEVIAKVRNGKWYKASYLHFGDIEFVAGVYSVNPERFTYTIEPGKTYYIKCTVLSKGFKVTAELALIDEAMAKSEMSGLKEQAKAK